MMFEPLVVYHQGNQRTSSTDFFEQRLGVLQVGGVEALGEPVVDVGEHCGDSAGN